MSIPGKILIALLVAAAVALLASTVSPALPLVPLLLACGSSAVGAVLLSHRALSVPGALSSDTAGSAATTPGAKKAPVPDRKRAKGGKPGKASGSRERGTVKWFNGSKGFGFIVRENGEEIFVHYRSIVGEGRRGLRDGQAVEFRVETTDKGPQAEDVEGLD